jgi:histone-lysine N-methyltransferase SETMAR
LSISEATIFKILHEDLGMNKVSARWIPKLLYSKQKLCRQHICEENLEALADDKLFSKIITDDETWVYHWDPRTKQESMQWVHKGSPSPKKARMQNSSGKLMATVFWDMEGNLLIEYMKKGFTIIGEGKLRPARDWDILNYYKCIKLTHHYKMH